MFKNYLLITLRNLYKNRIFALINILGLGLALSVCIVAYFNAMFDYGFDRDHENFHNIYRINSFRDMQGRDQEYGIVPAMLGLEIENDIPGIDRAARLFRSYSPVKVDRDNFNRHVSYVDPEFLDIFSFPLTHGSPTALQNLDNVLISQNLAHDLFGNEDPTGNIISIFNDENKEFAYTISGVFQDLPQNSSFRIDVLTHFDNFLHMWNIEEMDWKFMVRALFILVQDKGALPGIQEGLNQYIPVQNKAREDFLITGFTLVPLKDMGDNSREIWSSSLFPGLHPAAVLAPPVMAIMILLIAVFNFANTAIASAGKRLKEIGVRKVVGGVRKQLMVQFLIENFMICIFALFVGIALASFLVPAYSSLWEYMTLKMTFSEFWSFWIFIVLLLLVTGMLAGTYPALYISSFRPVAILQGQTKLGRAGTLSRILLGLQLMISVMAIVSGIIFAKNARYQETVDLGYDRDHLIVVPIQTDHFKSFQEAVTQNPRIISVAGTQEHMGFGNYTRVVEDERQQIEVGVMDIGPRYMETMGLRILDGRGFDPGRVDADRQGAIVVNRKLVEVFGWQNPVGKQITMSDTTILTIIGVVDDFYFAGLWIEIEPTIVRLTGDERYYNLVVRSEPDDLPEILDYLRTTWMDMFPNYPFTGMYQEDTLQEEKYINKSIMKVFMFLAVVATILSMIGLYTLISLNVLNRTKEIGIRKVLGAPVPVIIVLLSRLFLLILLFSAIIGCVGGYYISLMLLDSIWDHFLKMTADIFILALIFVFVTTILTIIGKVYLAAIQNPVESLRYE